MSRIVTSDFLAGVFTNFKALYLESFMSTRTFYQDVVTNIPSTTREETYNWLGDVPEMREWVGERVYKSLRSEDFTIRNKKYELTVPVDRETFEDDRLGVIMPRIRDLGRQTAMLPDQLMFALLNAGESTQIWDGANFFSASHSWGDSGSQSNLTTGGVSATTIKTALEKMWQVKNDQGQFIDVDPNLILVSPDKFIETREALDAAGYVAAGSTDMIRPNKNGLQDLLKVQKSAKLGTNRAVLLETGRPTGPVIFQPRTEPEFAALTDPGQSKHVFDADEFVYGTRRRCGMGYGIWYFAHLIKA